MNRDTPQERGMNVSIFLRHNSSVVLAQREYRRKFPGRPTPPGQTLRRLVARLGDGRTRGVIGPYFFEDAASQTTTVDGERYRAMLNDFPFPQLDELGLENMWFQQDGATVHTAQRTPEILRVAFPGRLISRFGDLHQAARSSDLSVPDFFLWRFLKSRVYVNKPQTLEALKENIRHECENLSPKVLARMMENAINRTRMVITSGGGHLPDMIFST